MTSDLLSKMALSAWDLQVKRADQLINSLTDEQLMNEVAPGRNRGIYLIGHLAATHDAMNDILGLGNRSYAHLDSIYLSSADKSVNETPSLAELKKIWAEVNSVISERMHHLPAQEWFTRHTRMTDEDFAKDPARNKLSVLLNRTNHIAYHLGQLVFLKSK